MVVKTKSNSFSILRMRFFKPLASDCHYKKKTDPVHLSTKNYGFMKNAGKWRAWGRKFRFRHITSILL